ncbi:MAG: SRPBCC domain-containing protein [Kofleriaceae bacterium]
MIAGDKVRVQTFVAVPLHDAFSVFTEEIDQWWRRGPAYRIAGKNPGTLHLEPKLGGRIFEEYSKKSGTGLHEIGTITTWEPPNRLVFEWRGVNFVAGESTTVEVVFEASGEGTRVTLEHRGWAALRADHPVRHGKDVQAFIRDIGMWWGGLLTSMRERATSRTGP